MGGFFIAMPTFDQLSTLTANLGFAIAIATFLVFMVTALVIMQMVDLRNMQKRHASEREAADKRHTGERDAADKRHMDERAAQEERHSHERAEWRQTQAALLARFAEAQEHNRMELIGELKQQTRLLERADERTRGSIVPEPPAPTPRPRKPRTQNKENNQDENV